MDKSKLMMVVIIALLLMLLGTVVGVGVFLITRVSEDVNWTEPQPPGVTEVIMPADLITVSLGTMTANLALGPNNRSDNVLVEVDVGLNAMVDDSEFEKFYAVFNRGIPIARAEVLDVFVSRTYYEVRTSEGRAETAEIIKLRLQDAFGSNLIVSVSFSEFNAHRGR